MGHGFMPQHFQIEYLARAGMLHPRFPDLTGEWKSLAIESFAIQIVGVGEYRAYQKVHKKVIYAKFEM